MFRNDSDAAETSIDWTEGSDAAETNIDWSEGVFGRVLTFTKAPVSSVENLLWKLPWEK